MLAVRRCLLLAASLLPFAASFQMAPSMPSVRHRASASSPLVLMQFGGPKTDEKKDTAEPNFLDKMRGVVSPKKTDAEMAAAGEDKEDSKALMQKVKDAGVAGIIS